MRRIKRKDWFPIVATDLFCGALAAVIIIDAVTPKESGASPSPHLAVLEYKKDSRASCADTSALVFAFSANGKRYSTAEGLTPAWGDLGSKCQLKFLLTSALSRTLRDPELLVAQYPGSPGTVSVRIIGFRPLVFDCTAEHSRCTPN
jgi:hypothetical protein